MLDIKIDYPDKIPVNVCISQIHEQPVHSHYDDLELIVMLKGSIKAIVGYNTLILKEGETCVFNDQDVHGLYETGEENLVLTVHINLSYFRKYNEAAYDSFFLCMPTYLNDMPYDEPVEEMKNILFHICSMKFDQEGDDEALETVCVDLLAFLLENFQYFYCSDVGGRHFINRYENKNNQAQAFRMRALMYFLWDNYEQKVTLKEYADKTYINMYYLSHMIKTSTGLNFQDLLNYTRVERSEELLLETDHKISKIAMDCGFSATRYYEKYFKLWFKVSPEEYRNRNMRRLTIPFRETVLEPAEALSAISDYSNHRSTLSQDRTLFYTNVIEVDVEKKSRRRKDPFPFLLEWNYEANCRSGFLYEELRSIAPSFRLCAPVRDVRDFNDRLLTFLRENDQHALLLTPDYTKSALRSGDQSIDELISFCRSGQLSHLDVYIAFSGSTSVKNMRRFSDRLVQAGRSINCKITVKDQIHSRFDHERQNYFLDSIYAVPWIIHSCLNADHAQEVISTAFDNASADDRRLLRGDCGVVTSNGIRKPSYYAYLFLSMLGDSVIYDVDGYIVTRRGQDIIVLFYDYDPEFLRRIDDFTDWKRLSVLRFAAKRFRDYKLDLINLNGKYNVTEIRLDSECCIFSKMVDLGMPEYLSAEDESLLRDYLKPEVRFHVIDGRKDSSVFDVQIPRFGALCLKFHKILD